MKLRSKSRNWITIIGSLIAAVNLLLIIVLFIISSVLDKNDTYLGLFIYIILPGFLILGLIMIPLGIIITRRKTVSGPQTDKKQFPVIDLNRQDHRKAFLSLQ